MVYVIWRQDHLDGNIWCVTETESMNYSQIGGLGPPDLDKLVKKKTQA